MSDTDKEEGSIHELKTSLEILIARMNSDGIKMELIKDAFNAGEWEICGEGIYYYERKNPGYFDEQSASFEKMIEILDLHAD